MWTQLPLLCAFCGVLVISVVGESAEHPRSARAATAIVTFGPDTVIAQVASTPSERNRGLQGTTELPDGTGMLFVFNSEVKQSFWMEDTPIDLDIAFLDAAFRVVDVQQMEALSLAIHESRERALYALEVRRGWFAEHGIRIGDVARIEIRP